MNCLFLALRVCQSEQFKKLSHNHEEFVQYYNELYSCVARMDSELVHRLLQRSQAFPTVRLDNHSRTVVSFNALRSCYYLRAVGRKVLWSSACVCLSVCLSVCLCVCAHCFCPQDISRTGSWITTKFGGWEQGVNL